MWTEYRTPEGKLVFRVNWIEGLIESVKNGWIVTVNMNTKQVLRQRRA